MRRDPMRDEGGAALMEATFVLPLLLLLVFGTVDVSLYLWNAGLARKAVQLGLRQAIVSAPVAVGPGLSPVDAVSVWAGLPPGARCAGTGGAPSFCPSFAVRCSLPAGCRCENGGACGFLFEERALAPVLSAMRAVLPSLRPDEIELSYRTNGAGYVTRPGPVPVDVGVALVGHVYRPLFFGDLMGRSLSLDQSASLPAESLGFRR